MPQTQVQNSNISSTADLKQSKKERTKKCSKLASSFNSDIIAWISLSQKQWNAHSNCAMHWGINLTMVSIVDPRIQNIGDCRILAKAKSETLKQVSVHVLDDILPHSRSIRPGAGDTLDKIYVPRQWSFSCHTCRMKNRKTKISGLISQMSPTSSPKHMLQRHNRSCPSRKNALLFWAVWSQVVSLGSSLLHRKPSDRVFRGEQPRPWSENYPEHFSCRGEQGSSEHNSMTYPTRVNCYTPWHPRAISFSSLSEDCWSTKLLTCFIWPLAPPHWQKWWIWWSMLVLGDIIFVP